MKNEIQDFIKSDLCTECDGLGYLYMNGYSEDLEQCESCEEWHKREIRADRMHDIAKGN